MNQQARLLTAVLLCLLGLALQPLQAQAQTVAPWFRGGKQLWEALLKQNMAPVSGKAALSVPFSNTVTGFSVKTTPYNWLLHRVSHSGVFSRMEKEILLQKKASEKAVLGKLSYFHDRDAQLFNALSLQRTSAQANEPAFWRHQNLLADTLAELESFFRTSLPEHLTTSLFSQERIKQLLADPVQPPAFVLGINEINFFASLSSLEQQRAWTQEAIRQTSADLNALLAKDPQTLKNFEFERFYLQKLRLEYFKTLQKVLSHATRARNSLIIRRKRVLKLDLPGAEQPMTDAQRMGFLHYHLHKSAARIDLTQKGDPAVQNYLNLQHLTRQLSPVYEIYAEAEAFGVPYEQTIRHGSLWPDIILGPEKGKELRHKMGNVPLEAELSGYIEKLKSQMALMQAQTPDGLDFYVRYYRLERTKSLYDTYIIRERLRRGI